MFYHVLNSSPVPLIYKYNSPYFTLVLKMYINENKMNPSVSVPYLSFLS